VKERIAQLKLKDFAFEACPPVFWNAFGEQGHAVRTTVSEIGPLLLSRAIEAAAKSTARAIGSGLGREIVRGVLGSLMGGGKRRR